MIDGGAAHGAQHPVGHVGGAGNLKEMTAGAMWHDSLLRHSPKPLRLMPARVFDRMHEPDDYIRPLPAG